MRPAQEGLAVTRLRLGNVHSGFGLGGDKKYGDTVYFGSRSSEFHMCFYEKGYEQAEKLGLEEDKIDKSWNRYELRFRQKRAVSLARALAFAMREILKYVLRSSIARSIRGMFTSYESARLKKSYHVSSCASRNFALRALKAQKQARAPKDKRAAKPPI